ncbi:uncharacterized protein METZ01_LOCUS465388, partial [marine metagenome]
MRSLRHLGRLHVPRRNGLAECPDLVGTFAARLELNPRTDINRPSPALPQRLT